MKKELRGGYTTGACMAAGVKAALLYRAGEYCERVLLTALDGTPLDIPVAGVEETEDGLRAEIVKESGDDPDITNRSLRRSAFCPQAAAFAFGRGRASAR